MFMPSGRKMCSLRYSSNGTPEGRLREAADAAAVLGAVWRENLGWPDGGIDGTTEQIRQAVDLIRRARPRAIAIPYWSDRHPDHDAASAVCVSLAEALAKGPPPAGKLAVRIFTHGSLEVLLECFPFLETYRDGGTS